jgi:hypothetical protein
MKAKGLIIAALVMAAALCRASAQPTAPSSFAVADCREGKAQSIIGELYSDERAERARQASGARTVRRVQPGGPDTMDLRSDRLNLEVDQSGIIRDARCG